jgi:hypothetical protein
MENSTLEHLRYPIGDLSHQQSIQENITNKIAEIASFPERLKQKHEKR